MIKGISTSQGYAFGKVKLISNIAKIQNHEFKCFDDEKSVLNTIIKESILDLKSIINNLKNTSKEEQAKIFEAHLMILEDEEFINNLEDEIKNNNTVFSAVEIVCNNYIKTFENMDNDYFKDRAMDIKDIKNRLLSKISGEECTNIKNINEKVIIVAEELTPSDTVNLNIDNVMGFITQKGGINSHSAIIARNMGIPSVSGIKDIMNIFKEVKSVAIDGYEGKIILNPLPKKIQEFKDKIFNEKQKNIEKEKMKTEKAITEDGKSFDIYCNIGNPSEVTKELSESVDGIGLFRTEFLFMKSNKMPTEEEQFLVYKEVLQKMSGKPVIIRTLDIGGDKEIPYLKLDREMNPFLGNRAIRLCFTYPNLLITQLRALLRASIYGNLKIMFPMISSLDEVIKVKKLLSDIKNDLENENIEYNNVDIGIMIEIPSAAIISDILAKYVDFFSIGTNDLMQYLFAADRMNEKVSEYYDKYNPSLMRVFEMIIKNAHDNGIEVGMCGELAGDEEYIPCLMAMEIDELSMSYSRVNNAKYLIKNTTQEFNKNLLEKVKKQKSSLEVQKIIKK